jgi:2-amino-4-hydroxy-6-hydroxymethyldihydropteridine diphosphokinase
MSHVAYLGFGANLDNPAQQIADAVELLQKASGVEVLQCSKLYGSKPLGPQDQPDYVNAVCKIAVTLSPQALLEVCQQIEHEMGRIKKRHWGERTIDVDILLYDELVMQTADLTIPHAQMHLRDFVLVPLAEIAPALQIPNIGTVEKMFGQLEQSFLKPIQPE